MISCSRCGEPEKLLFTSWYCDCPEKVRKVEGGFWGIEGLEGEAHACLLYTSKEAAKESFLYYSTGAVEYRVLGSYTSEECSHQSVHLTPIDAPTPRVERVT